MERREFITLLGGAAATQLSSPASLRAAPKRPIIGVPVFYPATKAGLLFTGYFMKGLQDRGYVVDRDLDVQFRGAEGDRDRWPAVIEEVIQLKPDVIYAFATLEAVATRKATSTIPIVCSALGNPRSSWPDSERGATGRQRHRNNALCCRIACETNRACARNSAGCEHRGAAYKSVGPKSTTPSPRP